MLHNNKQFIIHFWAYPPKPLFCKFFPHRAANWPFSCWTRLFQTNTHTFTFENQLFFNKTCKPNFSLPRDLANQFFKISRKSWAYERTGEKNLLFQQIFFAGNFTLLRCYARKVVRLGLRNFSLKQTKVTLVSWRFYAQCRPALKCLSNPISLTFLLLDYFSVILIGGE